MKERIREVLEMSETADLAPGPYRALSPGSKEWMEKKAETLSCLLFPIDRSKERVMQKFLDFFEHRKMKVELTVPYKGRCFTVTEARTRDGDGIEFVAEGVARRSLDKPDDERASSISGGRAIKTLYLKVNYHEEKKKLTDLLATADMQLERNQINKMREHVRLLDKHYKSLIHGHIHLLLG